MSANSRSHLGHPVDGMGLCKIFRDSDGKARGQEFDEAGWQLEEYLGAACMHAHPGLRSADAISLLLYICEK